MPKNLLDAALFRDRLRRGDKRFFKSRESKKGGLLEKKEG